MDMLFNFHLECGARIHKLRVYETMTEPTGREVCAYLLVRGSVHAHAYALDSYVITKHLMKEDAEHSVGDPRIMDILEFGRIIHAEMSAICDAARNGLCLRGGVMYCTTFPCHICAKHIIAVGICRVVYLEPYPKSYAFELHSDSIAVDPDGLTDKVRFELFIGVAPYRYRDLFEKGRRKYAGLAQQWYGGERRPMIEVYYPSYFKAETHVVGRMRAELERLGSE